ncbi:alkaline phosphatase [Tsukamurella strandjordii]|uniref:alkaline phosphatase D family protein n=1 Tax=Tsukamurella TaxID=2060 RepID=UPI001C7CC490|nr:alkaline phosphatase D family protein [Tsukamurella sp. TY48]GIZ99224.1 alkaline phosphatase [Tsukamurella sp. TY48]
MSQRSATFDVLPDRSLAAGTSRRRFMTWMGLVGGVAFTPQLMGGPIAAAQPLESGDPFTLGVASGDPLPDGVVLWTRLARSPLQPGGGMPDRPVAVQWEIAADRGFRSVIQRGETAAVPQDGHSVHVDVRGLRSATDYYYRFRSGPDVSPIGRTRTAPAAGARVSALSFAVVSCQAWTDGYFNAFADLAAAAPDVVFHLGDYVYEYEIKPATVRRPTTEVPQSAWTEMTTLADYRDRYALYKLDPDLQAAHRAAPFICAYDDHEVENNWAAGIPEKGQSPSEFIVRRAAAFKAWWENMPVRAALRPDGPDIRMYRRFDFGDLARFSVLDTRQYRSDQANDDKASPQDAATADPARTITGAAQEKWILDGLATGGAQWNVLAHQTTIADLARNTDGRRIVSMDGWSGYEASRSRILDGAAQRRVSNLVSIVGDIHRNVVSELKSTYTREAPTVGVELAGTSIASGKDGKDSDEADKAIKAASPHVKFGNAQRGYVLNRLSRDQWRAEFRVADSIASRGLPLHRRAVISIPSGRPEITVD